MLDDDVRELARAVTLGSLTTLMRDGTPQVGLVWPHADDEHVLIGTSPTRQKYRNVVADPRATILLMDQVDRRRHIEVRGEVVDVERGEAALSPAHTTFSKWTGDPTPRPSDGERVLLRLLPRHIHRKE
ncbi:pyridoxamine 5'-phosphate oxidase family protein [Pseudonocardia tropica]|uniref:Pyridoxamine 5'-phosphate oxidase family protein n=1 Tax=Pseudonocardia tropica TaxID=681289 RepID=A0ABV1JYK5_9PSEU